MDVPNIASSKDYEEDPALASVRRFAAFDELSQVYPDELEALRQIDIPSVQELTLERVKGGQRLRELGLPSVQLDAIELHAEMINAKNFTRESALALVGSMHVGSREQLACSDPAELARGIQQARESGAVPQDYQPTGATIEGWIWEAKGFNPHEIAPVIHPDVKTKLGKVLEAFEDSMPGKVVLDKEALDIFVDPVTRYTAYQKIRGVMLAAGVADLATAPTFRVAGRTNVRPGRYVGNRYTSAEAAGLPVNDSVIIGSLMEFVQDGILVIGRSVRSLIIIVEELQYGMLKRIELEDRDVIPEPRPVMNPPRAATGDPCWLTNVYQPSGGNRGADGGPGSQGSPGAVEGIAADDVWRAPDVEIYVQRTPQGMPNVVLRGRPGGRGQQGQHGGNGGDGARGRPAEATWVFSAWCNRGQGDGGTGGKGGDGGKGARGGRGGTGGSLRIMTLPENIAALYQQKKDLDLGGGPGGEGGLPSEPGHGGRGGARGENESPCVDHLEREGIPGADGAAGTPGDRGPDGEPGRLQILPISLSDWHAALSQPWLDRLFPLECKDAGDVTAYARNITDDAMVILDGTQDVRPLRVVVATGMVDFRLPTGLSGGPHTLTIRISSPEGYRYTNSASVRVLPQLDAIAPSAGLPGTVITLTGSGFADKAVVRVAGRTYPPSTVLNQKIIFSLPGYDDLDLVAGTHSVSVVNPDSRETSALSFGLTYDIRVPVKAWRVLPDMWIGGSEPGGPDRSVKDIVDLFTRSPNPAEVWIGEHIVLEFEPKVGKAYVPSDWADSWPVPPNDVDKQEIDAVIRARFADGTYRHYKADAVNFYFVTDINDWETHAYTYQGRPSLEGRQHYIVFEDTPLLTSWEDAHVAAHELGHVFGLPHICDSVDKQPLLGRDCGDSDKTYLMYPYTSFFIAEGNDILPIEAARARAAARYFHVM